jgi:glutamine synthetase
MDGGYPFHDPHADGTVSDMLLNAVAGDAIARGPGDFATTLQAAAANMRASGFAAKYFGPDVVEHYVCVAKREAVAQAHVVSAEERARYMFTV